MNDFMQECPSNCLSEQKSVAQLGHVDNQQTSEGRTCSGVFQLDPRSECVQLSALILVHDINFGTLPCY